MYEPPNIPTMVEHAYDSWRSHHRRCDVCSHEFDWFNPGYPRITEDPREADAVVKCDDGREVLIVRTADPESVLCPDGARLWRNWVLTTTHVSWVKALEEADNG